MNENDIVEKSHDEDEIDEEERARQLNQDLDLSEASDSETDDSPQPKSSEKSSENKVEPEVDDKKTNNEEVVDEENEENLEGQSVASDASTVSPGHSKSVVKLLEEVLEENAVKPSITDDDDQEMSEEVKKPKKPLPPPNQRINRFDNRLTFLENMMTRFQNDNSLRERSIMLESAKNRSKTDLDQQMVNSVIRTQAGRLWNSDSDTLGRFFFKNQDVKICTRLQNCSFSLLGSTPELLESIAKSLQKTDLYKRLFVQQLYKDIRDERDWEKTQYFGFNSSPKCHNGYVPKMTMMQGKALTLLIYLEKTMPGMIKYMSQLIHNFILSNPDSEKSYKAYHLANVTRFLAILLRYLGKTFYNELLSTAQCVKI